MPAAAQGAPCDSPNALGVSRTVEIDTTGGPGFGSKHYKVYDFLLLNEVVLTFDDGPQVGSTHAILEALARHCTKATFFSVGKMAAALPGIIRDVAAAGHTVGTHTWSHADLSKMKAESEWKGEIEKAVGAVHRAVGGPIAPFFRYPYLRDSRDTLAHLANRNMGVFSADLDSFDFKLPGEKLVAEVMGKLERKGKGIILMHDVHPGTAKALPVLLDELKAGGYKVVHMKPRFELKPLAEYDASIEGEMRGMAAASSRPLSSVIPTVGDAKAAPVK